MNHWAKTAIFLLSASLSACGGSSGGGSAPETADSIVEKIGIEGATIQAGDPPDTSPFPAKPLLSTNQANLVSSPGDNAELGFLVDLQEGNNLSALLAKVVGSSSFFLIDQSTAAKRSKVQSPVLVKLNLGASLQSSDFCIDFQAQDSAFRVSEPLRVCFVLPSNNPAGEQPLANAGPDQTVRIADTVRLIGSATSPGAAISGFVWSQTQGPSVSLQGANSSILSFTAPEVSEVTTLTFNLQVTDERDLSASDSVNVRVLPASAQNEEPLAEAGPALRVAAEREAVLRGDDVDVDGSIVSRLWTQTAGPAVSLTAADTQTARFVAPILQADTTLSFRYEVQDDAGASGADTTNVVVLAQGSDVNDPPLADAGQDQTVEFAAVVTLNGAGSSDPDGQIVSYLWSQRAGIPVSLSSTNSITPNFTAPGEASELEFLLTVTDNDGAQSVDTVLISVVATGGQQPVVTAGVDRLAPAGATVELDGRNSFDPDGGSLSFAWTQTGGPGVTLQDASSALASFIVPNEPDDTVLSFQLTVTNEAQQSASDQVDITIGTPPVDAATISFDSAQRKVQENAGNIAVSISVNPPAEADVILPFSVGGGALQGQDYTLLTPSPITISAGEFSGFIELQLLDDAVAESEESIILTLGQPNRGELGFTTEHIENIVDDEGLVLPEHTVYAVTDSSRLLSFSTTAPGNAQSVEISGLTLVPPDDNLPLAVALEVDPGNGELLLLTSDHKLYDLNPVTGVASLRADISTELGAAEILGMDFDPCSFALRLLGSDRENFRFNFNGSLIARDTDLAYDAGDPRQGLFPGASGLAYAPCLSNQTTAYVLDVNADALLTLGSFDGSPQSPDSGRLFSVGDFQTSAGGAGQLPFDIHPTSALALTSEPDFSGTVSRGELIRVDLGSGAFVVLGRIVDGDERTPVSALAISP